LLGGWSCDSRKEPGATTKGGGSDTARKHYLTNLSGDALISLAGFFIKEQNNDPLNTSNHQLMQTVNRTK
jgi:hypothetical protein